MPTSNVDAERRLRLRAEELIAGAAGAPVELATAFEDFDAAVVAAVSTGAVDPVLAQRVTADVVDALASRGVTWLVPALPDLDVAALFDAAYEDGPVPEVDPEAPPAPGAGAGAGGRGHAPTKPADPARPPWWAGLPAVEVAGPPGATEHRIRWEAGRLVLLAHPDPDAELAMAALGAVPCPCVEVEAAWRADHRRASVLTVAARHPGDEVRPLAEATQELTSDLRRWRGALADLRADLGAARDVPRLERVRRLVSPVERTAARRLGHLLLLGLEPPLLDRLQASVAAALAEPGPPPPTLEVATAARALPVLRTLGWDGGLADVRLGGEASVGSDAVVLSPAWLASVWGRGLAGAAPGRLVTEVVAVEPAGAVEVLAAAPGKAQVAMRVDQWENAGVASTPGAT